MGIDHLRCHTPHDVVRTFDEMQRMWQRVPERQFFADQLGAMLGTRPSWQFPGVCGACEVATIFEGRIDVGIPDVIGGPYLTGGASVPLPNFRESVHCPRCGLNTRQRLAAELVRDVLRQPGGLGGRRAVYLHEQVTAMFRWAESGYGAAHNVVGSEFLGLDKEPGRTYDGLLHQDIHALTFDDDAFDLIVSTDVLEHVWDVDAVLAESVRVLRPGGYFVLTVPWNYGQPQTVQAARRTPDGIEYLERPEIHGNPTAAAEGSLLYYRYGWDLLDRIRQAGFEDAAALAFWSPLHGVIGERCQWVLVAQTAAA